MNEELREELLRRVEKDQVARRAADREWEQVMAVDAENLPWLKSLVAEIGWPGRSMVGKDGAQAAWLLAQHADSDPAFQRQCLDLLTEAVERGEASRRNLAYLTDRVLLAEGQFQEYGTQMTGGENGWAPRKLRDPEHVDERRAAVGLGPVSEYIDTITRNAGPPKPARITCQDCKAAIDVWLPDEGQARDIQCSACGWTSTISVGTPPREPDRQQ